MSSGNDIHDERQILKNWLDNVIIIDVVFPGVCNTDDFIHACKKLTRTLKIINDYVVSILETYNQKGTVKLEELSRVIISASIAQLRNCSSNIRSYYLVYECNEDVLALERYINILHKNLLDTWLWLSSDIFNDTAAMARYGQTMLEKYREESFIAHRDAKPELFMPLKKPHGLNTAKMNARDKIMKIFDEVVDTDNDKIVLEALGRYLWNMRSKLDNDNPENSILFWIMVYEHYMKRLGHETIYSNVHKSDATTISDADRCRMAETPLNDIKKAIVEKCKIYFASEEHRTAVAKMFDKMLDSSCRNQIIKKLAPASIIKFAHQIAGLLLRNKVLVDCSPDDIVKAMGMTDKYTGKPEPDTLKHYMNRLEMQQEIRNWIEGEIKVDNKKKSR